MAVLHLNFLSQALGMQTNVTVCLPSYSFDDSMKGIPAPYVPGMQYQTLYLLHGGTGDNSDYVNFTNIVRYADKHKIAVIMPCTYDSCYTDFDDGPKYYTYIAEELQLYCRSMFPLSHKREDTFVAGLSMGSHGAMKLAINQPERFAAALIMSGASYRPGVPGAVRTVNGNFDFDAPMRLPMMGITAKLLDPAYIHGTVNDVYAVARQNVQEGKPLPKLFFRAGDSDHALYRAMRAEQDLRDWGYETHFETVPGKGHEWDLWDDTLRLALESWLPIRHQVIYPSAE